MESDYLGGLMLMAAIGPVVVVLVWIVNPDWDTNAN